MKGEKVVEDEAMRKTCLLRNCPIQQGDQRSTIAHPAQQLSMSDIRDRRPDREVVQADDLACS